MIAQLPRGIVLNVTLALMSFPAWVLPASPLVTVSEGSIESGTKPGKAPLCIIQVEAADGKPLSNATVVCIDSSTNAVLKGTTIEGGSERFQTDIKGRFPLPCNNTNVVLVVANDKGFSLAQSSDLIKNPTMLIHPWGRIEGRRMNRGQPVADQRLRYRVAMDFLVSQNLRGIRIYSQPVVTDSEGRFVFEFVPPVDILLSGMQKHPEKAYSALQLVEVDPGKTNRIEVVTKGRTVVGRLELEPGLTNRIDFMSLEVELEPDMDQRKAALVPSIPKIFDTPEGRVTWMRDWYHTDAGRRHLEMFSRLYSAEMHSDGSFVADLIEPGMYMMNGDVEDNGKTVTVLREFVEIPQTGTNTGHEPFDVGKVTVKATLKLGGMAPDFNAMTSNGKSLNLFALRGKYVLLDFWATWCEPCVAEMPNLKETYDAFGKDGRFVMISLSLDSDPAAPKKFAWNHGIDWTQVFLDDGFNNVTMINYRFVSIPQILLIGPDGRILATDLLGPKIKNAVAAALAH